MFRYCENLDCWKSVPICYDELCTACFRSNSWVQDIKINSNCKLLNTSNGSRFHSLSYLSIADRNTITDDDCKTFMVSYYYYLANWIIRENLANFSTLTKELSHPIETTSSSSATNETLHMAVNQKSRRSVRGVSSLAAAKSFNHYDPYSRKQEKDKNKRSCISCYNKRKVTISSCWGEERDWSVRGQCVIEEEQLCCTHCAGKPIYCRGPIMEPSMSSARESLSGCENS